MVDCLDGGRELELCGKEEEEIGVLKKTEGVEGGVFVVLDSGLCEEVFGKELETRKTKGIGN